MKKLTLILSIFLIIAFYSTENLQAQNLIPSNDVTLNQNNLTFIEIVTPGTSSLEERKLNVEIEDPKPNQLTPVVVLIYSIDGTTELGTYTVSETNPLEVDINGSEWGVHVISYSEGTKLSVWTE